MVFYLPFLAHRTNLALFCIERTFSQPAAPLHTSRSSSFPYHGSFFPPTQMEWPYYKADAKISTIIKNLAEVEKRWKLVDTFLCQCPGTELRFEGFSCFDKTPNRCDFGAGDAATQKARNSLAVSISARRAMILADLILDERVPDGIFKDCDTKFVNAKIDLDQVLPSTIEIDFPTPTCPMKSVKAPWPMTPAKASTANGQWNAKKSRRVELILIVPEDLQGQPKKDASQCVGMHSTVSHGGESTAGGEASPFSGSGAGSGAGSGDTSNGGSVVDATSEIMSAKDEASAKKACKDNGGTWVFHNKDEITVQMISSHGLTWCDACKGGPFADSKGGPCTSASGSEGVSGSESGSGDINVYHDGEGESAAGESAAGESGAGDLVGDEGPPSDTELLRCSGRDHARQGSDVWCQCSRKGKFTAERGCKHKKACRWDGTKCQAWIFAFKTVDEKVAKESSSSADAHSEKAYWKNVGNDIDDLARFAQKAEARAQAAASKSTNDELQNAARGSNDAAWDAARFALKKTNADDDTSDGFMTLPSMRDVALDPVLMQPSYVRGESSADYRRRRRRLLSSSAGVNADAKTSEIEPKDAAVEFGADGSTGEGAELQDGMSGASGEGWQNNVLGASGLADSTWPDDPSGAGASGDFGESGSGADASGQQKKAHQPAVSGSFQIKTGICLDGGKAPPGPDSRVMMYRCAPAKPQQQWTYTFALRQIKLRHGACLAREPLGGGSYKAMLHKCDPLEESQQWVFDSAAERIGCKFNLEHPLCLYSNQFNHDGGKLGVGPCALKWRALSQQFVMKILSAEHKESGDKTAKKIADEKLWDSKWNGSATVELPLEVSRVIQGSRSFSFETWVRLGPSSIDDPTQHLQPILSQDRAAHIRSLQREQEHLEGEIKNTTKTRADMNDWVELLEQRRDGIKALAYIDKEAQITMKAELKASRKHDVENNCGWPLQGYRTSTECGWTRAHVDFAIDNASFPKRHETWVGKHATWYNDSLSYALRLSNWTIENNAYETQDNAYANASQDVQGCAVGSDESLTSCGWSEESPSGGAGGGWTACGLAGPGVTCSATKGDIVRFGSEASGEFVIIGPIPRDVSVDCTDGTYFGVHAGWPQIPLKQCFPGLKCIDSECVCDQNWAEESGDCVPASLFSGSTVQNIATLPAPPGHGTGRCAPTLPDRDDEDGEEEVRAHQASVSEGAEGGALGDDSGSDGAGESGSSFPGSSGATGINTGSDSGSGSLVVYSGPSSEPVDLVNGWITHSAVYGSPMCSINGKRCAVSGLIKGGAWGHVATLPAKCRPSKRLVFNLNNHAKTARVDVLPNGQVHWVTGGKDHGWMSLTGIAFAVAGSPETAVATFLEVDEVQPGLALNNMNGMPRFAQAKEESQFFFNAATIAAIAKAKAKVAAAAAAAVAKKQAAAKAVADAAAKAVADRVAAAAKVGLANSWVAFGGAFGSPTYTVDGKRCIVSGLIKEGAWGHLATLPANCRPSKRLVFNLNNNVKTARVDVDTNGQVIWVTGGKDNGWISLTGIAFTVAETGCLSSAVKQFGSKVTAKRPLQTGSWDQVPPGCTVQSGGDWAAHWNTLASSKGGGYAPVTGSEAVVGLVNSWVAFGKSYGSPTYLVDGGLCTVSGLIKGGAWGRVATLPANCRPSKRLVFNLNNHAKTARVDVLPNGQVNWVTGGKDHGWLSLTGIAFAVPVAPKVLSGKSSSGSSSSGSSGSSSSDGSGSSSSDGSGSSTSGNDGESGMELVEQSFDGSYKAVGKVGCARMPLEWTVYAGALLPRRGLPTRPLVSPPIRTGSSECKMTIHFGGHGPSRTLVVEGRKVPLGVSRTQYFESSEASSESGKYDDFGESGAGATGTDSSEDDGLVPSPEPAPAPSSCVAGLTKDGCLPNNATDCETCAKAHEKNVRAAGCTPEVVEQLCKAALASGGAEGEDDSSSLSSDSGSGSSSESVSSDSSESSSSDGSGSSSSGDNSDGDAGSSCAGRKTAPEGSAIWCQCSRKGNELTKENGCKEKKGCKWDGAKCAAQAPSSEGSGSSSDGSGSSASEDASEPDFLELTSAKVNSGISVVGAEVVGGVSKWERVGEAEAGDMSVTVDLTDAFGSSSIGQLRLHAVRGLSIIRFDTIGCVQEPPPGAERKPGPEPLLGLEPVEPEIPRLPPSPKVARKALMAESPQNLTYAEDTNMTAVYLPGSAAQRQYNRDPWDPVRKTCYT